MQVAKGRKCVPRQLRMTCEPRSGARRLDAKTQHTRTERPRLRRDKCRMATGSPNRRQGTARHSAGR